MHNNGAPVPSCSWLPKIPQRPSVSALQGRRSRSCFRPYFSFLDTWFIFPSHTTDTATRLPYGERQSKFDLTSDTFIQRSECQPPIGFRGSANSSDIQVGSSTGTGSPSHVSCASSVLTFNFRPIILSRHGWNQPKRDAYIVKWWSWLP